METETEADFKQRQAAYQTELEHYRQAQVKWDFYQTKIKPYVDWTDKYAQEIKVVDEKIEAHNEAAYQQFGQEYFRNFWVIKFNKSREDESKVMQSVPGQILAGGQVHFSGERLLNDRSHIIAGQGLDLKGNIENLDEEGLHCLRQYGKWQI